ncbi:MAG: glycosyltransferase family 4 protein [Actinobacteria bacterium]|nr:glycosyltransferase family 4 protein [Actinomycetota bacterium]
MRIALHTQYFAPEPGAPSARLKSLASTAMARGHDVCVLTGMPSYPQGVIQPGYGGTWKRDEVDGVPVFRSYVYPSNSLRTLPRVASYSAFAASSAIAGLALPPIDLLITESPPLTTGPAGYFVAKAKRAKWIFNVSDLWPKSAVELGVLTGRRAIQAAERLEAFCYRSAWMVSGQSESILADIHHRFPAARTVALLNGVDTQLFGPHLRDEHLKSTELGGGFVALYAGLHGLAQGLRQLLDAAALLRDLPEVRIVLIGDGPEKEALIADALARGLHNVRFLPGRPPVEVPALLASADVALVPLRGAITGAVPSKVYEAFASGLPVVLAADGEAAEIVESSGAGLVVSPDAPNEIASAIRSLYESPERRAAMAKAGRVAATSRFDRVASANRFLEVVEHEWAKGQ